MADQAKDAEGEEREVLETLKGARIVAVTVTEDGMHIDLEDGRTLVMAGVFCAMLMAGADTVLH